MGHIPEGDVTIPGQGGGYKSPIVHYLRAQHRHMARLTAMGVPAQEIATATGYTPGQISRILGSPLFQAEVARLTAHEEQHVAAVQDDLKVMSTRAIEILSEDLEVEPKDNATRTLRQRAAFDVLDRAGFSKKEQPQLHAHLHAHLSQEIKDTSTADLLQDVLELSRVGND